MNSAVTEPEINACFHGSSAKSTLLQALLGHLLRCCLSLLHPLQLFMHSIQSVCILHGKNKNIVNFLTQVSPHSRNQLHCTVFLH
eukprot:m.324342 g.324342  ORF g.324342 m.324342 type:complete len:85 (-) comp32849_c0_seq1:107-361(-)